MKQEPDIAKAKEHYTAELKIALFPELVAALELCGTHCCQIVHHAKADQHSATWSCPVEDRIEALLKRCRDV